MQEPNSWDRVGSFAFSPPFCFEDLVISLSFAFKGRLVYFVFPTVKRKDTPFLHLSSFRHGMDYLNWSVPGKADCCWLLLQWGPGWAGVGSRAVLQERRALCLGWEFRSWRLYNFAIKD